MEAMQSLKSEISAILPAFAIRQEEPLSKHTSFRIGGGAEVMAFPKNVQELSEILKMSALLDCKPAILGAGTNVLAPDEGLRGLVICIKDAFGGIERLDDCRIRVMCTQTKPDRTKLSACS